MKISEQEVQRNLTRKKPANSYYSVDSKRFILKNLVLPLYDSPFVDEFQEQLSKISPI